jgi:hypothetical protein
MQVPMRVSPSCLGLGEPAYPPNLGYQVAEMLTDRRRVEAIDPEDGVIHSIADSVSPFVLGKLHDSPEVESTQHGVVKGGGTHRFGAIWSFWSPIRTHCELSADFFNRLTPHYSITYVERPAERCSVGVLGDERIIKRLK